MNRRGGVPTAPEPHSSGVACQAPKKVGGGALLREDVDEDSIVVWVQGHATAVGHI